MIPQGMVFDFSWPGVTELLVRSTVVLAAAWMVHPLLNRVNPRWRVLLWRGAVGALFLLPLTSAFTPSFNLALPQGAGAAGEWILTFGAVPAAGEDSGPGLFTWLFSVWAAGALFSMGAIILARNAVRRTIGKSLPAGEDICLAMFSAARGVGYLGALPDLRFSPLVNAPFACGILKPVIILPERMLAPSFRSELEAVLAHEVSHLGSADLAWNFAVRVLRALLWFHPFAWGLPAAHRAACEDVCNAAAARHVGDVRTYSKTLVRVALETIDSPLSRGGLPMATRSTILRRLDFLKLGIHAAPLTRAARGGFALAGLAVLLVFSALSLGPLNAAEDKGKEIQLSDSSEYQQVVEAMPRMKTLPPRPEMPAEIARQQVSVNTKIELFVKSDGTVNGELSRLYESSGYTELDEIALEWAKKIEFHPAKTREGKPVAVRMAMPVMWKSK